MHVPQGSGKGLRDRAPEPQSLGASAELIPPVSTKYPSISRKDMHHAEQRRLVHPRQQVEHRAAESGPRAVLVAGVGHSPLPELVFAAR